MVPLQLLFLRDYLAFRRSNRRAFTLLLLMAAACSSLLISCTPPGRTPGEPAGHSGAEFPSNLVERFGLSENYAVGLLHAPPVLHPRLTRSLDGTIFMHHNGNSAIYKFDPSDRFFVQIFESEHAFSTILGGPGESILVVYGPEIKQLIPGGSFEPWGSLSQGAAEHSLLYTPSDRIIAASPDGKSVVDMSPDGNLRTLAAGFGSIHDLAAGDDGKIYVSDAHSGKVTVIFPGGATETVFQAAPDPLNLDLDSNGELWINNIATGFARIDLESQASLQWFSEMSECQAIHTPGKFFFTPDDQVIFQAVTGEITWVDIETQEGGIIISTAGANSPALAIGPDQFLYFGSLESGERALSQVFRISDDLDRDVIVRGLPGFIVDIAFDTTGGFYILCNQKDEFFLYYHSPAQGLTEIAMAETSISYSSMAVHPENNNLLIASGTGLFEYDSSGYIVQHELVFPKAVFGFKIAGNLAGDVYIAAEGEDNFFTGPVVKRWLFRLNLHDYSLEQVAQSDLTGCGPMTNLAVDPPGNAWWLLNPDFRLYRVTPEGEQTLFAENLFVDPAGVAVDASGDIYFSSPEGIYRIYQE